MSYCSKNDVKNLCGDLPDDPSDALLTTVINNSTSWIDSTLKKNYVPIPEVIEMIDDDSSEDITISTSRPVYNLINVPSGLRTAAIYHAASDIILSLYHGDELPVQYDIWFRKAQTLLNDYIDAYLNSDADESDLVAHQMVKHSKARTYNQKRGRRGVRRWVR